MALVSGVGGGKGTATKTATGGSIYSLLNPTLAAKQAAQKTASKNAVKNLAPKAKVVTSAPVVPKGTTTPVVITDPGTIPPVFGQPVTQDEVPVETPVDTLPTTPAWALESDPLYKSALSAGQAQFNYARNAALAEKQTQELGLGTQRKALDTSATESRRRTAGNYAARGMAGGAAGALALTEARANAEQVAARTSIADQITALNNNFLQNYGDVSAANYDWTGTLTGQQYKTQAAQQALEAALARYGTV